MMQVIIGAGLAARRRDALVLDIVGCSISRAGERVFMARMPFRFVACLAAASGQWIQTRDLIEALWGDDEDGGPLKARQILSVMKSKARRTLRSLGLFVDYDTVAGFRLVEIPVSARTNLIGRGVNIGQAEGRAA